MTIQYFMAYTAIFIGCHNHTGTQHAFGNQPRSKSWHL